MASAQSDLDGPLVDYAAKGTKIDLDGVEKADGRDNYKLKLTLSGRKPACGSTPRPSSKPVYYRDYRSVSGLQIPFVLETRVLPVEKTATGYKDPPVPAERLIIEKVTVNPKLDDSQFSKPKMDTAPTGKQPQPPKAQS